MHVAHRWRFLPIGLMPNQHLTCPSRRRNYNQDDEEDEQESDIPESEEDEVEEEEEDNDYKAMGHSRKCW